MTPDERDRLSKLEQTVAIQQEWLRSMDHKLDELIAAANMGKGAWWFMMKIGGLIIVLGAGMAWLADHLWK